jgi:hypothetical protein
MAIYSAFELITYATNPTIPAVFFRGNSTNNYGIKARYDTRGAGNLGMGVILNNPYSGWNILSNPSPGEAFPSGTSTKRKIKIEVLNNIIKFWYAQSLIESYVLIHSYDFGTGASYNTAGRFGIHTHYGGNLYIDELKLYQSTTNVISTTQIINYNDQADQCVIENRLYQTPEKTELLLFKGNDTVGTNGADRIRLRAANIAFDTYSATTTDRNTENIKMIINESGDVGIGTITPGYKLDVNGSINISNGNNYYINGTTFSSLYLLATTANSIFSNINSTSTTIFTNLNNLSTNSTLSINNLILHQLHYLPI